MKPSRGPLAALLAFCTGTLVAPRVVLTAAHCVATKPRDVAFGTDPTVPAEIRQVLDAHADPDFDAATHDNDVAFLLLDAAQILNNPLRYLSLRGRGRP